MCAAIESNYVLAPSGDPHLMPLSLQEQLSPLVSLPCHPLKVSFQRIAGVCLGRNNIMTYNRGRQNILAERCHSVLRTFDSHLTTSQRGCEYFAALTCWPPYRGLKSGMEEAECPK